METQLLVKAADVICQANEADSVRLGKKFKSQFIFGYQSRFKFRFTILIFREKIFDKIPEVEILFYYIFFSILCSKTLSISPQCNQLFSSS